MSTFNRVTVYLGSSGRCRQIFKDTAAKLGTVIGEKGKSLVYGGMDSGLMGIVANTALSAGARVTGVIPKNLKDSERIHPNLSETILVPDLWERKLKMFKRADVIIVLPGGFGTLDEMLEVFHWAELNLHQKPTVLINIENYYNDLIDYLKTLPDFMSDYLIVVNSVDDVFTELDNWSPPENTQIENNPLFPHYEDHILSGKQDPMIFATANIKNSYTLATALGLKQLDKHTRPLGILNDKNQFNGLLKWIDTAEKEHFITDRCKMLFSVASRKDILEEALSKHEHIHIDLQHEKWGASETATHIEITEKE